MSDIKEQAPVSEELQNLDLMILFYIQQLFKSSLLLFLIAHERICSCQGASSLSLLVSDMVQVFQKDTPLYDKSAGPPEADERSDSRSRSSTTGSTGMK